jgi:predicted PurR-regulated permease PerM
MAVDTEREAASRRLPGQQPAPPSQSPHACAICSERLTKGALVTVATIAAIALLKYAQVVFESAVLALLLATILDPLVVALERARIMRPLGAAVVMLAMFGGLGYGAYRLEDRAIAFVDSLPHTAQKLQEDIRAAARNNRESVLGKIQRAADEIDETVAAASSGGAPEPDGMPRVRVEDPKFESKDYLWAGSVNLGILAGQATVVVTLAYFILAGSKLYRRKFVRLSGPGYSNQRGMVEALSTVKNQMVRFLLVQVLTCFLVAVATWGALLYFGLKNAFMWGLAAGILNFVPYFGPAAGTLAISLAAFLQFGTIVDALKIGMVALAITSLEGVVLKPVLMALQMMRMSSLDRCEYSCE